MKKKILALCVVISLAAVAIIGGTLAYFTDTDEATNTFTVGSVSIDLIESQYHRVNAGKGYTTETEPISGGYLWASNVPLGCCRKNNQRNFFIGYSRSPKLLSPRDVLLGRRQHPKRYM